MATRSTLTQDVAEGIPTLDVRHALDGSRLAVYAILGASIGGMPLPWLPDSLLRRVRGALVHDFAMRRGLSLTGEARAVLAEPSGPDGPRGLASQALRYLGVRLTLRLLSRLGPVAVVWPLRDGLRTYLLGHLFDRYLEVARIERAVRIDADEARRVRRAIDGALARSITVDVPLATPPTAIDDQRDPATTLLDGLISVAAGLPDRLVRRLDAAFDELLAEADG
jgi:hypothetical protein